jgi:hypothetical protein
MMIERADDRSTNVCDSCFDIFSLKWIRRPPRRRLLLAHAYRYDTPLSCQHHLEFSSQKEEIAIVRKTHTENADQHYGEPRATGLRAFLG